MKNDFNPPNKCKSGLVKFFRKSHSLLKSCRYIYTEKTAFTKTGLKLDVAILLAATHMEFSCFNQDIFSLLGLNFCQLQ